MEDIIEINGVKYKRIEEEQKPTGWERSDEYYPLWNDGSGIHGEYTEMSDWNTLVDDTRYNAGMYFSDKELARNMTRAVSLFLRMNRFAAQHQKNKIDLFDPNDVFVIDYNYYTHCDISAIAVCPDSDIISPFQVYFDSRETAEAAIEEFHDDLIWYLTEFKNTMRF